MNIFDVTSNCIKTAQVSRVVDLFVARDKGKFRRAHDQGTSGPLREDVRQVRRIEVNVRLRPTIL